MKVLKKIQSFGRSVFQYSKKNPIIALITALCFLFVSIFIFKLVNALVKSSINIMNQSESAFNLLTSINNYQALAFQSLFAFFAVSFLYYNLYNNFEKIKINESTENINDKLNAKSANKELKDLYNDKDQNYIKIKKLANIRWVSRFIFFTIALTAGIFIHMGAKNFMFKDALYPAIFMLGICLALVIFNNYLSRKIEKDTLQYDKKIINTIEVIQNLTVDDFKIFNQLMLERKYLGKSIYISDINDVIKYSKDGSHKSLGGSLWIMFSQALLSINNLVWIGNIKNNDQRDSFIEKNFNTFYKIKSTQVNLTDSCLSELKKLNKNSGLLEESTASHDIFRFLDAIHIEESMHRVFD